MPTTTEKNVTTTAVDELDIPTTAAAVACAYCGGPTPADNPTTPVPTGLTTTGHRRVLEYGSAPRYEPTEFVELVDRSVCSQCLEDEKLPGGGLALAVVSRLLKIDPNRAVQRLLGYERVVGADFATYRLPVFTEINRSADAKPREPWAHVNVTSLRDSYDIVVAPELPRPCPAPGGCALCCLGSLPRFESGKSNATWANLLGVGWVCSDCRGFVDDARDAYSSVAPGAAAPSALDLALAHAAQIGDFRYIVGLARRAGYSRPTTAQATRFGHVDLPVLTEAYRAWQAEQAAAERAKLGPAIVGAMKPVAKTSDVDELRAALERRRAELGMSTTVEGGQA